MKKYSILMAAAPLALLVGCGDGAEETTETDVATSDMDTMADDTAMAEGADTGPATKIADAGDFSGTYNFAGEGGNARSVKLNASDSTYRYTRTDGTEQRGKYTVTPDGYRIYLDDYYGRPAWFLYRNDAFDLIEDDIEYTEGAVITGQRYTRAVADDEVPSRRPELGSSVDRDDQ